MIHNYSLVGGIMYVCEFVVVAQSHMMDLTADVASGTNHREWRDLMLAEAAV
jgi:hypothetical protein